MNIEPSRIFISTSRPIVSSRSVSQSPCTEIRNSAIEGRGAFATRDIKRGESILQLSGERATLERVLREIAGGFCNDDPLQVQLTEYILLDEKSKTINHSCDPSAGIRGEGELVALRNIRAGEEVTYDYSITGGRNITPDIWTMHDCKCGSSQCRGKVANILTIPPAQLEYYLKSNAIPKFNIYVAEAIVEESKQYNSPLILGQQVILQSVFLNTHARTDDESVLVIQQMVRDMDSRQPPKVIPYAGI